MIYWDHLNIFLVQVIDCVLLGLLVAKKVIINVYLLAHVKIFFMNKESRVFWNWPLTVSLKSRTLLSFFYLAIKYLFSNQERRGEEEWRSVKENHRRGGIIEEEGLLKRVLIYYLPTIVSLLPLGGDEFLVTNFTINIQITLFFEIYYRLKLCHIF